MENRPGKHFQVMFCYFALIVFPFIVYANSFNVPFVFDDFPNIVDNRAVHISNLTFDQLMSVVRDSFYRSRWFANITFALNYFFHRLSLPGYHLVNILIHIGNAILLYHFINFTIGRGRPSTKASSWYLAVGAALLWSVNPANTQAVTYIVQRMTSLAAFFYLGAMLSYIKCREAKSSGTRIIYCLGVLLCFFFGMGSKEIVVTLPVMIFIYEWYFFQDLDRKWLRKSVPLLIVITVALTGTAWLYLGGKPLEAIQGTYSFRDYSLGERLLTEARVIVFYLSLFILPGSSRLNLEHDFALSTSVIEPFSSLLALIFLGALFFCSIVTAKRHRVASFALLWFFINLALESSFIGLEIVFEHRLYLPSMLLLMPVAIFTEKVINKPAKAWIPVIIVMLAVLLSSGAYSRNLVWSDRLTLWTDCVRKSPEKWRPRYNLGKTLLDHWQMQDAQVHLIKAVKLSATANVTSVERSWIHFNLALAYARDKKFIKAADHFSMVLRYDPTNTKARKILKDIREKMMYSGRKDS